MDDYERLQKLLALVRDRFCNRNGAELARRISKDPNYVNRLFYPREKNGAKGIGPEITKECTKRFDLPRGFWDMAPGEAARTLDEIQNGPSPKAPTASVTVLPDLVITQYDAAGAMGNSGLVLEDRQPGIIKSWRVDQEWLRLNVRHYTSISNLCIVTGFGNSMKPRFNPGDPLLMDRGITSVDVESVYFFRLLDHGFIKQLQRIPTKDGMIFRAKSYNPDYDPFDITPDMDFQVFGKILTIWKSEQV